VKIVNVCNRFKPLIRWRIWCRNRRRKDQWCPESRGDRRKLLALLRHASVYPSVGSTVCSPQFSSVQFSLVGYFVFASSNSRELSRTCCYRQALPNSSVFSWRQKEDDSDKSRTDVGNEF